MCMFWFREVKWCMLELMFGILEKGFGCVSDVVYFSVFLDYVMYGVFCVSIGFYVDLCGWFCGVL